MPRNVEADIKVAEALLRMEEAALIVASAAVPIVAYDIVRIVKGWPSVSVGGGFFFDRYPKTSWTVWIALGLHFSAGMAHDPLNWIGGKIRGRRVLRGRVR